LTLRHYLRHYCHMNPQATVSNPPNQAINVQPPSQPVHRSARYQKVLDGRKQPVRGLWERNGRFIARITVESNGTKQTRWVPLGDERNMVDTVPQAIKALRKVQDHREADSLPALGLKPKFADFVPVYFEEVERRNRLARESGNTNKEKRSSTIDKERGALRLWQEHLGDTRLNKVSSELIEGFIRKRQDDSISNRTILLDIIALRNVLKFAIKLKHVRALPQIDTDELDWTTPKRALVTAVEIESLCSAAFSPVFFGSRIAQSGECGAPLRNAQQFSDYIKLMAYCGARRDETLRLEWKDAKWEQGQIEVGSDGLAKNHKSRFVDFNDNLEAHLKAMHANRAPDCRFLFPSPQRGDKDERAKTFRESLDLARTAAKLPHFGFHDCRHFFISYCVMAGIDFMTIAEWVGHQDGGILIGKVYGHLADEHRKRMAKKIVFGPRLVEAEGLSAVQGG
jgi:integrase